MVGFKEFEFEWNDKKYVIPPHRVLGAIASVEEVLTLPEMQQYASRGVPPLGKISMAYGRLLRYAGAPVSDTEVYHGMFGIGENVKPQNVLTAMHTLVAMMIPPEALTKGVPSQGNAPSPPRKKNTSRRHTS